MENAAKPRVAVVGCGYMGCSHAATLLPWGRFELAAVVDVVPQTFEEIRKLSPTIRCYTGTDEMLAKEHPDIVIVATTVKHHFTPTMAALRAGAHVLCEKPLARTLAEMDDMLAAAAENGRLLLVNNEYNVNPRTRAALQLVRAGGIGDVVALRGSFKGNACGGRDLADGAPHLFALAIHFAGQPLWVAGEILTGNRPATVVDIFDDPGKAGWIVGDRVYAVVGFERGVVMHAEFLGVKTNAHLLVIGTRGAVCVPFGVIDAAPSRCDNPNDPQAKWEPVPFSYGSFAGITNASYRALTIAYDHWADWLATGQPGQHPLSAVHGRQAMEVIHGVMESHFQQGQRITLPLANREHPLERRR